MLIFLEVPDEIFLQMHKIITSNKVVSKIVFTGIVFNNTFKENLEIYKTNKDWGRGLDKSCFSYNASHI
jgi:hypothetical protein